MSQYKLTNVALIDLDGTVADYDAAMHRELLLLAAPGEVVDPKTFHEGAPPHLHARQRLIRNQPGFWRELPRIERGFEVVDVLREIGYQLTVLTKGPKTALSAWTEKAQWAQQHLPDANIAIVQDKAPYYGKILFDDFPPYFLSWLEVRPRGLVIALEHPHNKHIEHPNLLKFNGQNLRQVYEALQRAYDRAPGEGLTL